MILILMGPMGCGKTTIGISLAKRLGWPFYDGDDFHPEENVLKMRAGIPLTDGDRQSWLETLHAHIQGLLHHRQNAVIACSALKKSYRDILGVNQTSVRTIYLKGPYELLRKRIEERKHPFMNKDLLKSQLDALEEPDGGYIVDISPSPETVVDTIMRNLQSSR
jgi:carbohydrate kinase (thermoresistant glucokinase family)